jgi:hypothetical protein
MKNIFIGKLMLSKNTFDLIFFILLHLPTKD